MSDVTGVTNVLELRARVRCTIRSPSHRVRLRNMNRGHTAYALTTNHDALSRILQRVDHKQVPSGDVM